MADAGKQQNFPPTIDIPLAGTHLSRGTTATLDQRYINVLFEPYSNPLTGGKSLMTIKRPGLAQSTQPPAGSAAGRGIYGWGANSKLYSVFDNKIYSGTSDLGVTLAASTGRCWFAETAATSSEQILVISDGTDNYHIATNDAIVQIDENDDAQYPASNLGPVIFFDDYIVQAQSDGEIWNTEPDDFDNWTASNVISAGMYGDGLEAIVRLKDQIMAMGKHSIEFFFNNGTANSPFLRIDQNSLTLGLSSKNTLAWAGDTVMWVAEAPGQGSGGRQVWVIESSRKGMRVSTPAIERILNAEGSSISSATAWMENVAGHLIYVLRLSSTARTFVYDLSCGMWTEWTAGASHATQFAGSSATSLNGVVYVQDVANGRIYTLNPTTYQDNGTTFTVTIQTDNYDFGTPLAKFQSGLWLLGDNTTGTIDVSEADDDFTTFNTARSMDVTGSRKYLPEGGMFFQRAYKLDYTQNAALRLQKMSLMLDIGDG
jgi:hypothetical protein